MGLQQLSLGPTRTITRMKTLQKFFVTEKPRAAFSLVEVLAAIAIIGVITFLAIPNIVQVKRDSEEDLARSRAAALNVAMASYVQNKGGLATAKAAWPGDDDSRYTAIKPFLSFAETNRAAYMPSGYSVTLPTAANLLGPGASGRATVTQGTNVIAY